jgi:hypothetical protein
MSDEEQEIPFKEPTAATEEDGSKAESDAEDEESDGSQDEQVYVTWPKSALVTTNIT